MLCDPMDYTVRGILQAGILEWVAIPFSRGSSQPRNQTEVSCIAGGFFTSWATREALKVWSQKVYLLCAWWIILGIQWKPCHYTLVSAEGLLGASGGEGGRAYVAPDPSRRGTSAPAFPLWATLGVQPWPDRSQPSCPYDVIPALPLSWDGLDSQRKFGVSLQLVFSSKHLLEKHLCLVYCLLCIT